MSIDSIACLFRSGHQPNVPMSFMLFVHFVVTFTSLVFYVR